MAHLHWSDVLITVYALCVAFVVVMLAIVDRKARKQLADDDAKERGL